MVNEHQRSNFGRLACGAAGALAIIMGSEHLFMIIVEMQKMA
jgi:hypothetical protein